MDILVTGGAGFIGSHLTEVLLEQGHHVTVLDDLSTGKRANLPESERLELVVGDAADPDLAARALAGKDALVHLAAIASVQASVEDPVGTHHANLEATLVLLEAARKARVARVVYASSAAVYGDTRALPIDEGTPTRPLSPYAIDKLSGEHHLAFHHQQEHVSAVAFRFFNIYGPRQDPGSPYSGVISIFADRVRHGRPVTLFGDGKQTRDFLYVGDLVRILADSLHWPRETEMPVLNVGRGERCSLLELLAAIEAAAGRSVERDHAPPRPGDIRHSQADITRLRERLPRLNFTPLGEGLKATLDAD